MSHLLRCRVGYYKESEKILENGGHNHNVPIHGCCKLRRQPRWANLPSLRERPRAGVTVLASGNLA